MSDSETEEIFINSTKRNPIRSRVGDRRTRIVAKPGLSPFLLEAYVFRKESLTIFDVRYVERQLKNDPQAQSQYAKMLRVRDRASA